MLRREYFQSRIGLFKTPKTQRYIADLIICQVIHGHVALLYCNALLQLYPFVYIGNSSSNKSILYDFFLRCFIASSSEYFFNVLSIFALSWYLNIPVVKLWGMKWKRYGVVNFLTCIIVICYSTHYLVQVAESKYPDNIQANLTKRVCNVSQLLFF